MSTPPQIIFEPLHPDVQPPQRATAGSAGMDAVAYLRDRTILVYAGESILPMLGPDAPFQAEDLTLFPGWRAAIPLGFKAQLPPGFEMQVRSRSGLALKKGLVVANAPGTIDADYPGEWCVILQNTGDQRVTIAHGDRIAQLVLARVETAIHWAPGTVGTTTERAGGFGSTGQ